MLTQRAGNTDVHRQVSDKQAKGLAGRVDNRPGLATHPKGPNGKKVMVKQARSLFSRWLHQEDRVWRPKGCLWVSAITLGFSREGTKQESGFA
jgi:hypothetical protein